MAKTNSDDKDRDMAKTLAAETIQSLIAEGPFLHNLLVWALLDVFHTTPELLDFLQPPFQRVENELLLCASVENFLLTTSLVSDLILGEFIELLEDATFRKQVLLRTLQNRVATTPFLAKLVEAVLPRLVALRETPSSAGSSDA